MNKYYLYVFLTLFILGCDEPPDSAAKIFIYGIIYPNKSVEDIIIERNFPLDNDINSLPITDAEVIITDRSTNENYKLTYNPITKKYDCVDLIIKAGITYRLTASATIDGKNVQAYGATNVPGAITINKELSKLESFSWEEKDINGNYKYFEICWEVLDNIDIFYFTLERINYVMDIRTKSEEYSAYLSNLNRPYGDSYYTWPEGVINLIAYHNNYTNSSYSLRIEGADLGRIQKFRVNIFHDTEEYRRYGLDPKKVRDANGNLVPMTNFINGDGIGFFGTKIIEYSEELML